MSEQRVYKTLLPAAAAATAVLTEAQVSIIDVVA